jgi:nicotinamide-nucleotide amidase
VTIELITTGSELMLGRILNSHQQWICRQLADLGYTVKRHVSVSDTASDIGQAVKEALARANWVITTGGLGPTSDDLTRDAIASLLGRSLRQDPVILEQLKSFFSRRNRPMPPNVALQALVPEGATILDNPFGTAPGVHFDLNPNPFQSPGQPASLFLLPGPPRELRPMFTNCVLPLLLAKHPPRQSYAACTLRTVGIGESHLEHLIAPPLQPLINAGLEIGYCSRPGEVDVRLSARGRHPDSVLESARTIVRNLVGHHVYGENEDELDAVVVNLLRKYRRTLATAESCTGGLIANRITNIPGASTVFTGSFVTYSDHAKQSCLGVRLATLESHGAVSEATAREMASGARDRLQVDYALGVTGIAGPEGGSPDKPVGTVFIALATPHHVFVIHPLNPLDRLTFKYVVSQQALDLLRRTLLADSP